jgi:hypothetical protein
MLFREKQVVVWAYINLLIFHTYTRKQFLGLVHVFRHFMELWNDIADQFYKVIVAIIQEEILRLNGHKLEMKARRVTFVCSYSGSSEALRSLKNVSTSVVGYLQGSHPSHQPPCYNPLPLLLLLE